MRRPWIKIETCTPDKPEICSVATHLRMDPDTVVGKLVRLWSWAEKNRIKSNDLGVTKNFLDKLVGRKGFALALEQAGWLLDTNGKLSFRNFQRHNHTEAQNRALTAMRVARHRQRKLAAADDSSITDSSLQVADNVPERNSTSASPLPVNVPVEVLPESPDIQLVSSVPVQEAVLPNKLPADSSPETVPDLLTEAPEPRGKRRTKGSADSPDQQLLF